MENYFIRGKKKRSFHELDDDTDDTDDDHLKYIYDDDDNYNHNHNNKRNKNLQYSWMNKNKLIKNGKKKKKSKRRNKNNQLVQPKKKRKISNSHKIDQYFIPKTQSIHNNNISAISYNDNNDNDELLLPSKPSYTQKILNRQKKQKQQKKQQKKRSIQDLVPMDIESSSDNIQSIDPSDSNRSSIKKVTFSCVGDDIIDIHDDDDDVLLSMDPHKTLNGPQTQTQTQISNILLYPELVSQITNNSDIIDNRDNNNNHHQYGNNIDLWSEQYAPKQSNDIIGNSNAIDKLRRFLSEWKQYIFAKKQQINNNIHRNKKDKSKIYSYINLSREQYMNINSNRNNNRNRKKRGIDSMDPSIPTPRHKAALLTGPSGCGKTMSIELLSHELDFDLISFSSLEFHNSKQRNNIVSIFDNQKLSWYCQHDKESSWSQGEAFKFDLHLKPRLIVVEDVSYIADTKKVHYIINAIKNTKVPIILIANNYKWSRGYQQLIELKTHIQCIQFYRPNININNMNEYNNKQILSKLNDIFSSHCNNINVNNFMENLLKNVYGDLRSCLTLLQFWCDSHDISIVKYLENSTPMDPSALSCVLSMKNEEFIKNGNKWWMHKHDQIMDIFESNTRFFNVDKQHYATIQDGINWYFNCSTNSNLTSLFIQENYLRIPVYNDNNYRYHTSENDLDALVQATSLIADGDILDNIIHHHQDWKLMPFNAVISCVHPSKITCRQFGNMQHRIKFPTWFQENKKRQNMNTCLDKIHIGGLKNQCNINKKQWIMDYGPYLLLTLLQTVNKGNNTRTNSEIHHILKGYGLIDIETDDKGRRNHIRNTKINSENLDFLNQLISFTNQKNKNLTLKSQTLQLLKDKFKSH